MRCLHVTEQSKDWYFLLYNSDRAEVFRQSNTEGEITNILCHYLLLLQLNSWYQKVGTLPSVLFGLQFDQFNFLASNFSCILSLTPSFYNNRFNRFLLSY